MEKSTPLLKPLTEELMREVRAYGILEVSTEQYQNICNSIVRFAQSSQTDFYSPELIDSYKDDLNRRCSAGKICKEYCRLQLRVVRMLSSLVDNGSVDFSSTKAGQIKYIVSDETSSLVEKILDTYPISEATRKELRAPTRHFLWYAEQRGIKPERIDDPTVMSFLINEVPVSNGGSTGRTLRCVKYATEYLKAHGNCCIHRDYSLLKLKNNHRSIIPAYSEEEISGIAHAADTNSAIGKRDLAIILVAYCTGLRGIDIIGIRLSDIDWRNHKVSVIQSKTHTPIVSEMNGTTLNALADYILEWRPKCDISEVFITAKAPYRKLSKGFGRMIDKYCKKAGVSKIAFRGFHSIRRSFETVMVSRGVPIETASQMMGHKSITEDKPYITHDKRQIAFVAMDFSDVPILGGYYFNQPESPASMRGGGDS
ncbi:MAG: tyrosine-type recombinase/integrase [Lachnospiraceae bacterium]|nr:tyrosine-type recombinase/integrase [Lachnospiraceae bacterium]